MNRNGGSRWGVGPIALIVGTLLGTGAWAGTHVTGRPRVTFDATGPVGLHVIGVTTAAGHVPAQSVAFQGHLYL